MKIKTIRQVNLIGTTVFTGKVNTLSQSVVNANSGIIERLIKAEIFTLVDKEVVVVEPEIKANIKGTALEVKPAEKVKVTVKKAPKKEEPIKEASEEIKEEADVDVDKSED